MKKKVLFFLQSGVGGAERMTVTIAKSLSLANFDIVYYLVESINTSATIEEFIPHGSVIYRLKRGNVLFFLVNLFKTLKSEKPDIVFSSMMYLNTKLLALSCLFPKIKYIVRNDNYLYTLTRIQKLILKFTYKKADCIIAQTQEMGEELVQQAGIKSDFVKVLQNPIDTETIDKKSNEPSPFKENDSIKYVASGRFFRVKGFDILVKAFRLVVDKQPNSELYILGKKDENCLTYYEEINSLIQNLGLKNKVYCEGFQTNPYKYVKNADCFVLSSRNEGLPNVLIEALYLGTPAAATTCIPIISRIIEDGVTGFLAENESPESLAQAMLKAPLLGRIKTNYQSASLAEFQKLFEDEK